MRQPRWTREEFYAGRDSRTAAALLGASLSSAVVELSIDPREADTVAGQLAMLLLVDLTARWARRLRLIIPPVRVAAMCVRPGDPANLSLREYAAYIAVAADPFIDVASDREPTVQLHVGVPSHPRAPSVMGRGWIARFGDACEASSDSMNPLGPALAACAGSALIMQQAFKVSSPPRSRAMSLFSLGQDALAVDGPAFESCNFGRVLCVGCGAIGSSLLYLLPFLGRIDRCDLIDHDLADLSNLNRCVAFRASDVGNRKAIIMEAQLRAHGVYAIGHPVKFDEAVRSGAVLSGWRPDIIIPAADEDDVRSAIQNQMPPLQVYGTTDADWQAYLGRHIPLREDCLACRFPAAEIVATPRFVCSTGTVPQPEGGLQSAAQDRSSLPFLSLAAAALAAAECGRIALGIEPRAENWACINLMGPSIMRAPYLAKPGCICGRQRRIWARLNGASRFATLSL